MRIAVIGLGYVGLPLAVQLSKRHKVIGFDISRRRIEDLREGHDPVCDLGPEVTGHLEYGELTLTWEEEDLRKAQAVIVCVPTDIDGAKQPDLRPLRRAAETVGRFCSESILIINESTVYPGATQELFIPLKHQTLGYSPERIVPGKPQGELNGEERGLHNTVKIIACADKTGRKMMEEIYGPICGGLHVCKDIRVGEMAKLMENCQRDLNIALMNEASILANRLGIHINDVIDAASTKWNFHPYRPGLVGGHCIGVDPYYLAYAGARENFHAQVILAGRAVNDRMGVYVARRVAHHRPARVLICGYAFKENCGDCRNTRVEDIRDELNAFRIQTSIYDPLIDPRLARQLNVLTEDESWRGLAVDAIILAVPHDRILDNWFSIRECLSGSRDPVVFDLKDVLENEPLAFRL